MTPQERRAFVREHRTAILGYSRERHGPALSAVYYLTDGDELLISTMRARGKAGAVLHNPKVSLCVLDERWPPTYVTVFCDGVLDDDPALAADVLFRIMGVMGGRPISDDMRPDAGAMARRENRVVL